MTFVGGERVERSEVAPALAAANPSIPFFISHVSEQEEIGPDGKPRIRVRIELRSPRNEPLTVADGQTAVYYSLRSSEQSLPQVEGFAA